MASIFEVNELLDAYGSLLTPRQQEVMDLHFREDLSMSEIAENLGISRAGAASTIKKSTQMLEDYEQKIGYIQLVKKLRQIEQQMSQPDRALLENVLNFTKNE